MDLATLKTNITSWAIGAGSADSTLTNALNQIISNAEKSIYKSVICPDNRKSTTANTASGTATISGPGQFMIPLELYISGSVPMVKRSLSYLMEKWTGTSNGQPVDYALKTAANDASSCTLLLGPTPDATYTVNINYYSAQPTSLVSQTTGTWLSTNHEDVLLKASVYEAAVFLHYGDDPQTGGLLKVYKDERDEAIAKLQQATGVARADEVTS